MYNEKLVTASYLAFYSETVAHNECLDCTLCDVLRQDSATTWSCYYFHVPDSQRGRKVQFSIGQLGMIHGVPATLSKQHFSCTVGCRTGLKKDGVGKQISRRY